MMNRKSEALLGTALLFGATACSPNSPEAPRPEPYSVNGPGVHTRELLARDAPLRLIFVPITGRTETDPGVDHDSIMRQNLISGNQYTMDSISDALQIATAGEYIPRKTTLVRAGQLSLQACLDPDNNKQNDDINQHIEKLRDPLAINVLVVDQQSCPEPDGRTVLGYAAADGDPVHHRSHTQP